MKQIEKMDLFRHPYKYDCNVEFSTYEQMIQNAYGVRMSWESHEDGHRTKMVELEVGGSFARKQHGRSNRVPYARFGLELIFNNDARNIDYKTLKESEHLLMSAKMVIYTDEGTYYHWHKERDMKQEGHYPVNCEWDGITWCAHWNSKRQDYDYEESRMYQRV